MGLGLGSGLRAPAHTSAFRVQGLGQSLEQFGGVLVLSWWSPAVLRCWMVQHANTIFWGPVLVTSVAHFPVLLHGPRPDDALTWPTFNIYSPTKMTWRGRSLSSLCFKARAKQFQPNPELQQGYKNGAIAKSKARV